VHELAHVKYQVPNLASYVNYFQEHYQGVQKNGVFGHLNDDPSNQSVISELNAFRARAFGKARMTRAELLAFGHRFQ
jgi:hypothetical protein